MGIYCKIITKQDGAPAMRYFVDQGGNWDVTYKITEATKSVCYASNGGPADFGFVWIQIS